MTCVFPVHQTDVSLLYNLLRWIGELGDCTKKHSALIVADAGMTWEDCEHSIFLARTAFGNVKLITNEKPTKGWIAGSNSLWMAAAKYCKENSIEPWLFLETDAIPVKAGWLDELEKAYLESGKSFLACVYEAGERTMMSGIACYPKNTVDMIGGGNVILGKAFDVAMSENWLASGKTGHTPLIQHFYGEKNLPPTFRESKNGECPRNTFTLSDIKPETAIFHRNKDSSLIKLLRLKRGILNHQTKNPLLVVLPICNKDVSSMIQCLEWMVELDGKNEFDCLITYDPSLNQNLRVKAERTAGRAFSSVHTFRYPSPSTNNWPDACNWAFQKSAYHIQAAFKRPWLWHEADAVPLCCGWLDMLQNEYLNCGKPIMGPVVQGMGHLNGTAIYPANFPDISPSAMFATGTAWDSEMTCDIQGLVHDSDLIQHVWGMENGELHPFAGPAPVFADVELLRWLRPGAVWFHRCKDNSLINMLRKAKRK